MKRLGLLMALAIVAWYSFVICLGRTRLSDGLPSRVIVAQAALHEHFQQARAGEQTFGDLDLQQLGWTIVRITESEGSVRSQDEDTPHAILARPRIRPKYRMPFAQRILFLDFSIYEYRTYLLRSNGLFCVARKDPLPGQPPFGAKDVAEAESSGLWDECYMIPSNR